MFSGMGLVVWICLIICVLKVRLGMKWLFMMLMCVKFVVVMWVRLVCMFMKLVVRMLGLMCGVGGSFMVLVFFF